MFDPRLKDKIVKIVDISYGGENGFNQVSCVYIYKWMYMCIYVYLCICVFVCGKFYFDLLIVFNLFYFFLLLLFSLGY